MLSANNRLLCGNVGRRAGVDDLQLTLEGAFEVRVLEAVASGEQLGGLDAAAGQHELLAHLAEDEANDEGGHRTARLLPEGTGGCGGEVGTAQRYGTDGVDRATQGLAGEGELDDGSELFAGHPGHPLLTV